MTKKKRQTFIIRVEDYKASFDLLIETAVILFNFGLIIVEPEWSACAVFFGQNHGNDSGSVEGQLQIPRTIIPTVGKLSTANSEESDFALSVRLYHNTQKTVPFL